jgi:hypothetical protein
MSSGNIMVYERQSYGLSHSRRIGVMLRLFILPIHPRLSANAASVLACAPEILDVQVLPPLEPNTAHDPTSWRSNSSSAANPAASC